MTISPSILLALARVISAYGEPMKRGRTVILQAVLLAGSVTAAITPLQAAEKPVRSNLPGVDEKYRIVRPVPPAPEPQPDEPAPSGARYGDWEITISGDITIDVTTGNLPLPRH